MLNKEIQELLGNTWKEWVAAAHRIFLHAPGPANRATFFSGSPPPFDKSDPRIHAVPFTTQRPTMAETIRAADHLCHAQLSPKPNPQQRNTLPSIIPAMKIALPPKPQAPSPAPIPVEAPPKELHEAAKRGDCEELKRLLEEQGFDPTLKHPEYGHLLAYQVCTTKQARNVFRRSMAILPDMWDWGAAQVPGPLTAEMEAEAKEKQKEKEKQKKQKKQKAKMEEREQVEQQRSVAVAALAEAMEGSDYQVLQVTIEQAKQCEADITAAMVRLQALEVAWQEQQEQATSYSTPEARKQREREARALAAERRFGGGGSNANFCPQCHWCGQTLPTTPFQAMDLNFCKTTCVAAHRKTS